MDLQRSLLIGAIAVLSFMLLTEWVAFKEDKTQAAAPVTSRLTDSGDTLPTPPDSEQPVANAAADDIPTAPAAPGEPAAAEVAADNGNGSGRIVQVFTDELQLAIDLHGGDIVELALVEHLEELEGQPFVLLESNQQRTYVAQSGLIGRDGIDSQGRASYQTAQPRYTLAEGQDELQVDLLWTGNNGVKVTKRFTFQRDHYLIKVDYLIENNGDQPFQANLFGQLKRDGSEAPNSGNSGMGIQPFLGAATTLPDDRFAKFSFDDMHEEPFKQQLPGGWIAMIQHYFLSAWIPNPEQSHTYSTRVTGSGFNIAGFTSPAVVIAPGQSGEVGARFYAGPKDQYRLEKISPYLDLSVDYGWLWWIAQPLFWLLTKIHALVANWGVAIILLTVLIKAAFFKLSATSYRSMANMRRVQPKMQDIREQYSDDKQKQSQAMMELYRKEKINPLGGCLPILVQMPVFIALYWVLMESVELRHAPFALWINDLSVMDPYFVLPLLMGASMWFMQKLNPPPPDPMQAKIMQWMPVMFTFFFLWFPAGLVLYWLVNNLLSIAQQWVITRQIEKAAAA
ncbi:membrane protein insertase YidC [Parahaliea mediterranea]|uniref:Membrane protein insertase YidC n=1 Tax=Parahaliea mediterranea TaxID=651086 RepID=A0A939DFY3_9GAMM|nr:membrane protein insertase YidC [Parahaliea mediterranea]MBN7797171.1 membrane protein insertase YidC [Parahaliea mediterranea]